MPGGRLLAWCSLPLIAWAPAGCRAKQAPLPYPIVIHVAGDPGKPLANAAIWHDRAEVGRTAGDGVARIALQGAEGDTVAIEVTCPPGYKSPPEALAIRLHRLSNPAQPTEYDVRCPPNMRKVVVAVRATNGTAGGPKAAASSATGDLPVVYLGQELARTDSSGAAHIELDSAPDETIELTLATNDKSHEHLKPQNPSAKFVVKDQDEVFVFSTEFVIESDKRAAAAGHARAPQGPTRLPSASARWR